MTDIYTIKLLAWFYGMDYEAVRNREWTQEDIDKAQQYAIECLVDVEEVMP